MTLPARVVAMRGVSIVLKNEWKYECAMSSAQPFEPL
jgi:hypothetical protein